MPCKIIELCNGSSNPKTKSRLQCPLPCTSEFSTDIQRFRGQITMLVLSELRRCHFTEAQKPKVMKVISDTTTQDQNLSINHLFKTLARNIHSHEITLRNTLFEIAGFSSVNVRITGEIVIRVLTDGVDGERHEEVEVFPFTLFEIVQGSFPTNVVVEGKLLINHMVAINEVDPSSLSITGITMNLFFSDNIRILQR